MLDFKYSFSVMDFVYMFVFYGIIDDDLIK